MIHESQPEPASIDVQIGGITDTCGTCGRAIAHESEVGLSGVNAVLCRTCRELSARFSPWWVSIHADTVVDVWVVPCLPESPYWESTASPTFLETPGREVDHDARNPAGSIAVDELDENIQETVWWLSCSQLPPVYQAIPQGDLQDDLLSVVEPRLTYEVKSDDELPSRGQLTATLPSPFLVDQEYIYVREDEDAVREALSSVAERTSQATLC